MINALKALFDLPAQESPEELQHRLRLAAAALLVETGRADFAEDARERETMASLLRRSLGLSAREVEDLLGEAERRAGEATSLFEFTRLINDHFGLYRKVELIEAMWQVAYADGNLDKYEEALIRQVAELTYVPHADYIRVKLKARERASRG
jgi:uncharacterized tellurite resistance protein B-like protein